MNQNNRSIYWSRLALQEWNLIVAVTEGGFCFVGSGKRALEELKTRAAVHDPDKTVTEDNEVVRPYSDELAEYLRGKRQSFSFSFVLSGTPFQEAVWGALCEVPYGQTVSYSEIAQQIQKPAAVRAVGAAIGANPILIAVPCHRVIGKNGALTGYRGGIAMKTKLLELERTGSAAL